LEEIQGLLRPVPPSGVCSGHSAIGDVAAKTEAPSFTNDIVRSSSKLQIAAGEKAEAEAEKFRGKRARHCQQNWKFGRLVVENDV
jgi:hypothetical protein